MKESGMVLMGRIICLHIRLGDDFAVLPRLICGGLIDFIWIRETKRAGELNNRVANG